MVFSNFETMSKKQREIEELKKENKKLKEKVEELRKGMRWVLFGELELNNLEDNKF